MRKLSDTIERLARLKARPEGLQPAASGLQPLEIVGTNPGALTAWYRTPEKTKGAPPLVVVLHGCTQNAAGYDRGSGWSALAEDYGFAVLFPEQSRSNNGNLCFNWFAKPDVTRGSGEVLSIREMIATMISDHGVDPRRVYVTGLSAGGAMANSLLATYPEIFAGGAIIAGLPHAVAGSVPEAFDRMRGHGLPDAGRLQALLSAASPHKGPWPTVSIWQGTSDSTVADTNAGALIDQWRGALGVVDRPERVETVDGQERHIWVDRSGREVLDLFLVRGMGHGTPLDPQSGYGEAAPYMLDVGISSTVHIARNWGIIPSFEKKTRPAASAGTGASAATPGRPENVKPESVKPESVKDVIENALRAAGLMK
ncbi:PHB depolymerase family esterase [Rhizobiaceae bacterium CRRU44]|uniref:PHB depolymerase family esterase n=1 Tax=Ferranicluibacter rubi TaxID=2715133 RepID=A0AA43ZIP1_9HYPH|nr:PHB depolymerase family esterase [Ferranicluibacter rubi]NHT78389.1 PHB depolymerase family esterase [Ferranicluibacter rubi]